MNDEVDRDLPPVVVHRPDRAGTQDRVILGRTAGPNGVEIDRIRIRDTGFEEDQLHVGVGGTMRGEVVEAGSSREYPDHVWADSLGSGHRHRDDFAHHTLLSSAGSSVPPASATMSSRDVSTVMAGQSASEIDGCDRERRTSQRHFE
jgi:hypothetical protein